MLGAHAETEALDLERVVALGDLLAGARRAGTAPCRAPSCRARRTGRRSSARRSRCDDEPMPMANRPGRRRPATRRSGPCRPAPGVGRHDRRAEPQPRLPRRRQRQRREGVGAVGLGRPDVGVAEVGQLVQLSRCVCRALAAARSCQGGSDRQRSCVGVCSGEVAASSLAHDAALAGRGEQRAVLGEHVDQPVAEAALDAWTRMSSSTHSVGTRRTRSVLSRLLPPPSMPSAWPTPIGTKSPRTASAVASTPSITSGMRPHISVWPSPSVAVELLESRP